MGDLMLKSIFSAIVFFVLITQVAFADDYVQKIGDQFVQNLPGDWNASVGTWTYFDIIKCFTTPGASCFGNNPSSPYGQPNFLDPNTQQMSNVFQMNYDEAVVLIFRTPPQMRYYSFVQYLFSEPGSTSPVFASLSDAFNMKKLGTSGSNQIGGSPFDTYSAVVWTADNNTFSSVKSQLLALGLPDIAVNFYPLPRTLPLNPDKTLPMGYGSQADTFSMLMRTALPTVPANFTQYMNEKPFYVLKVGPVTHLMQSQAPVIGYASETSGIVEATGLQSALNKLVSDIKNQYSTNYALKSQTVDYTSKVGWDCIKGVSQCAGDNHDALYSQDVDRAVVVSSLDDLVIVAGVKHQKTGKATYINHAVYDTKKMAGIVSIADTYFTTGSALYHAGVTNPSDIRNRMYQNLYAYVISYNCAGRQYCLQIPAPTPDNPVGLNPGAPFFVMGRSYLEPHTLVRPSPDEIVHHQVYVASKK